MRIIPIDLLKMNSINGKNIYNIDGTLLIKEDSLINEKTLKILKKTNYLSVYVKDEYSSDTIEDMIPDELRNKAIIKLKNASIAFLKINANERMKIRMDAYMDEIISISKEMTDFILEHEIKEISSVDVRNIENYDLAHSVNVAIMSTIVGKSLDFKREELYDLCLAGMLHDIGKALIPREINLKKDKLTKDERKIFEDHSRLGFLYLNNYSKINREIKLAALHHHERIDGKGYPSKVSGDKLGKFDKVITLVDAYDNMITNRYDERKMLPSDVVEYLLAYCGQAFDYKVVKVFSRLVKPFSKGTLVKLSNNEIASVNCNNSEFPLRPIVKVIKSKDIKRIGQEIDLLKELSVTIVEVIYYFN